MSKLPTNDGVACDLCGIKLKDKFVYYNYDLVNTFVSRKIQPSSFQVQRKPQKQVDLCGNCNDKFTSKVVQNNIKRPVFAFCELTGASLEDGLVCMVFVSEITVTLTPSPKVVVDKNYLSFVMKNDQKMLFEPKIVDQFGSWESKS